MPLRHSCYGRTLCNLTRQHAAKTGRPPNFSALEAPAWDFFELMGDGPRQRQNDHKDHGNGDQYSGQAKPPHWKSVMFWVAADVAHVCLMVALFDFFSCHCVRPALELANAYVLFMVSNKRAP